MDAVKIVPACSKCVCFKEDESGNLERRMKNAGTCHRFPPQIVSVSANTPQGPALVPGAMFPSVQGNWFCAEFRPTKDALAANEGATKQ